MRLTPRQVSALRSTALRTPKQMTHVLEDELKLAGVAPTTAQQVAHKIVECVRRNQLQSAKIHMVLLGTLLMQEGAPNGLAQLRTVRCENGRNPNISSMTVRREALMLA